ncbi:MAG: glycine--tRNA ligase [Oscillospiraceae bacterium]|nr:glycine--tRNA ligase [Oscillospiraceae bacterium]
MDKIVALAKNRGFVFQGSEIYGGLANTWDYGPLGVELKNNVKQAWWQKFVRESEHNVGVDCAILMNPQVWVASGHVAGFADPLIDCRSCKTRHRADHLIEGWTTEAAAAGAGGIDAPVNAGGWGDEQLLAFIREHGVPCPDCGASDFTDVRKFNMMFKTFQGVTEDSQAQIYLRPETAQGIFVNFRNVLRSTRRKMPMGIGQIGKAFRNEITPGNFTFRTREFEQMELEFFCEPGTDLEWFAYWKEFCKNWLLSLGMREENLRLRDHSEQELSHYSNATTDFEYLFPFGWGELWGIADRTNFDLAQHIEHSKDDLSYFDPTSNKKYVPYCIEPSLGADRAALAFLCDAYGEEAVGEGDVRTVLRFHPALAPVKVGVLPLSKKLSEAASAIYRDLSRSFVCEFDDTGSIGKRYRRQDEIGTPYCVTYDFESENDKSVTIRERDSMDQVRVPIGELASWFSGKFVF